MTPQLRKVGGVEIARPPARHPRVERHHQRPGTRRLRARDQALRQLAVLGRVELKERGRVATRREHLLHGVVGQR